MTEYILTFFSIFILTLFKFIAGPVLGHAAGFSLLEIMTVTVMGMMSSVLVFTYLGEWIKREWGMRIRKKKVLFSRKSRRLVNIWQKFGPVGVAFLTPLLLTPIGGTIVLTTFGVKKNKILTYMLLSGIFWSFVFGLSIEKILEIRFFNELLN